MWSAFLLTRSHFQDYLLVKFLPGFPSALEPEAGTTVAFPFEFPTEFAAFTDNTVGEWVFSPAPNQVNPLLQ